MNKIKNLVKNKVFKISAVLYTAFTCCMTPLVAFAENKSGTSTTESAEDEIISEITKPTTFITNILLAGIAAGGIIVVIKGVFFDFIPAIQGHEGLKAILTGLIEMVLGVIMISASAILSNWGWL